ncbi:hypothetical protein AVEN_14576-1 [Araneus ventricosus]|uniref:Uncharacterized protein n=1 Tax=Araneus ventricosus TaxID=182803 RepID=A0A4Y2CGJ1_ARAVE|nr:hypothetical protein AVEN_14576-1 [Araneus ventricosus]
MRQSWHPAQWLCQRHQHSLRHGHLFQLSGKHDLRRAVGQHNVSKGRHLESPSSQVHGMDKWTKIVGTYMFKNRQNIGENMAYEKVFTVNLGSQFIHC